MINIKDNALFISDAHYNISNRVELYSILKTTQAQQIILFGDIFDLLFGYISYSIKINQKLIELINSLSSIKDIIYLEGNHDYNLKNIFPKIRVYTIHQQPLLVKYKNKKTLLAHGDIFGDKKYKSFTIFFRNRGINILLNIIDNIFLNNLIMKKLILKMNSKKICTTINNFESIAKHRVELYKQKFDFEVIIEGHFHQDKKYTFDKIEYINLPAFACNIRPR